MATAEPTAGVFIKGDLITATMLNEVNTAHVRLIRIGDHGWSSWSGTYYFYCTRASGELLTISASFGWNSKGWIELYRWENGTGARKNPSQGGTSGWWSWSWDKGNVNSYGEGRYKLYCDFGNFQYLNVDVHNSKPDCERGRLLAMIDNMELSESDIAFSRVHDLITAEALNAGRVYTI